MGVTEVLSMPFSGYDFMRLLQDMHDAQRAPSARIAVTRVFVLRRQGRCRHDDARLQRRRRDRGAALSRGADRRQPPVRRPSRAAARHGGRPVDRPTARRRTSSAPISSRSCTAMRPGVEVLLAPPRIEMAEMVTPRDIERMLSLMRKVYNVVIIDTATTVDDTVLAYLDNSDVLVQVVTYEWTSLQRARAMARDAARRSAFAAIGCATCSIAPTRTGGMPREAVAQTLGRQADFGVVSDGVLVLEANNRGQAVRLAGTRRADHARRRPTCRRGADADDGAQRASTRGAGQRRRSSVSDAARNRLLRLGRRRADGTARGHAPAAQRIDHLPGRQRARAVWAALGRGGATASAPSASTSSPRATSRRSSSPATPRARSPCPTCACATTAAARRRPARRHGGGARHAQPARRRHRHGRRPCARTPTSRRSRTRIRSSRSSSSRRRSSCRWSRQAGSTAPLVEEVVAEQIAPMLDAETQHRHVAARLHALPAAGARHRASIGGDVARHRLGVGDRQRVGRSARGPRSQRAGRRASRATFS